MHENTKQRHGLTHPARFTHAIIPVHTHTHTQRKTMKDNVKHKPVHLWTDTDSFLCAVIQVIELLRQSIYYLTLRKEKSMLLHRPCYSSTGNSTRQFKKTVCVVLECKQEKRTEHQVPQSGEQVLSITLCSGMQRLHIYEPHLNIFMDSSSKRAADRSVLTWIQRCCDPPPCKFLLIESVHARLTMSSSGSTTGLTPLE